jgi:hypothetical protein
MGYPKILTLLSNENEIMLQRFSITPKSSRYIGTGSKGDFHYLQMITMLAAEAPSGVWGEIMHQLSIPIT